MIAPRPLNTRCASQIVRSVAEQPVGDEAAPPLNVKGWDPSGQ